MIINHKHENPTTLRDLIERVVQAHKDAGDLGEEAVIVAASLNEAETEVTVLLMTDEGPTGISIEVKRVEVPDGETIH